jgi:predicted transcriptional regulator
VIKIVRNRVVTAHIPDKLARKLDNLAERLDRPRGWVVKEALEGYLALDEERHRQTLDALAEVDAGTIVEHEDVKAWSAQLTSPRKSRR